MKITRDVILDLLPLYLAEEVSADTEALVREYLESDPELGQVAERMRGLALENGVPEALEKEKRMEAYEKAQREITRRVVIYGVLFTAAALALLAFSVLAVMFLSSL